MAQSQHVVDGGAVGVRLVGIGVAQGVHDNPVGAVGLGEDVLAQNVTLGALVHETLAIGVHEDAVTAGGADVLHEARARGAAGVQLDVGQADELGAGVLGEHHALALGAGLDVGAADGIVQHDFLPHARVHLLTVLHVAAEAAGGDDHGAAVHGDLLLAVVERLHAHHGTGVIQDELFGLHVVEQHDGIGVVVDELLERADVGVARRRGRVMAALAERSGGRTDLVLELDAQALEPVNGI